MPFKISVLLVDDDRGFLADIGGALGKEWTVIRAYSAKEAVKSFHKRPDVVLLDVRLDDGNPTNREGLDLLRKIRNDIPETPVVMMTAFGQIDIAVEAMKLGAEDFIQKDRVNILEYDKILRSILEKRRLRKRVHALQEELERIEPWKIIGENSSIKAVKHLIEMAATDGFVTVLVTGATGTGKELVARAIHERGRRSEFPFVPVCISALNPNTVESELFGHEKGAFTGAQERHIGYFERADGGVLFLDEIGELSGELQVKLLRFIEDRRFQRMGSGDLIEVDVQLVAATNKNLESSITVGGFRSDLYYRLKTFQIALPPLSARVEDIPSLAKYFLEILRNQGRTRAEEIEEKAMGLLKKYAWPGNVRELRGCIERAVIFCESAGHRKIEAEDLPLELIRPSELNIGGGKAFLRPGSSVGKELARLELGLMREALNRTKGRKIEAQRLLGYNSRFTMLRRINAALKRFPDLRKEFPDIVTAYENR